MRSGVDVADASLAPPGYDIYLGYVDGNYVSYPGLRRMYPDKLVVGIAVWPGTNDGIIFDGPPDNATWPQVVDWVVMRRRAGVDPTVYTDLDQWSTAAAAFNARGVPLPHWWIAHWNGIADLPAGMVGHQYADVHEAYDLNEFADYWPGVDPPPHPGAPPPPKPVWHPSPPPPPPPPPPPVEEEMLIVNVTPSGGNSPGIWLLSGPLYVHVPAPGDVSALAAAGVKQVTWSYAMHQATLAAAATLHGNLSGSLGVSGSLNVT